MKRISPQYLRSIELETYTEVYKHKNYFVREIFWRRLERLLSLYDFTNKTILDLGCGEGILFPSLAQFSEEIYGIDMITTMAERIIADHNLKNITLVNADIQKYTFPIKFDVIICADVLEHFKDLSIVMDYIYAALKPQGNLLLSVPTENTLYRIGRLIFGFQNPEDHYHNSREIVSFISNSKFKLIKNYHYPARLPYQLSAFEMCLFQKL